MGICDKVNQNHKISPENNMKIDPKTNHKISPENNMKIDPKMNHKRSSENNMKIESKIKHKISPEINKKMSTDQIKKYKKNQEEYIPVPFKLSLEASKCICMISKENNSCSNEGTGFFMKVNASKKYLVTNYNLISQGISNENILLKLSNKKEIKLNLKGRHNRYFQETKDIALIEIKDTDEICKDIKFLTYDLNYKFGYEIYKNQNVFTVGYSGGEAFVESGKIVHIKDYEFYHDIPSKSSFCGCPIMLYDRFNLMLVIGIHKEGNSTYNLNHGTFIADIFGENKEIFINRKKKIKNDVCVISIISGDQHVNISVECEVTDNFSVLEEKLYADFPDLKNKEIIFLANGGTLDRSATIGENGIKNGTTIVIVEL